MPENSTLPFLDRLLSWSIRHQISPLASYAIATSLIVVVGLFRVLVVASIVPWLLFVPVVLAVGLLLGRAPGVYAALLAAFLAGLSIGNIHEPLWLSGPQWTGSVLFVLIASGTAVLAAELRAAFARARQLTLEKEQAIGLLAQREAFLSSVLASSTDCIKVLDLDGRITFMSDGGQRVMEVDDFNSIAGCPWPDVWEDQGNADARAAVVAANLGESRTFTGKASTFKGTSKWWHVAVSPVLGPDGEPSSILSVSRDVTVSRENEEDMRNLAAKLAFEQATLKAVFLNAPVGLSLAAANGQSVLLNEEMRRLLGRDISQGGIDRYLGAGAIHDDGSPYILAEYPQVNAIQHGVSTHMAPFLIEQPDGSRLRTEISSVPLRAENGVVTGAVSVVVDVEERERAIEHQELLTAELAHRMKNTMAMVQAIVHQSLRSAGTLAEARENVVSRFEALVRAQDLLTSADWKLTNLSDVTDGALAPFNQDARIVITGEPIEMGARAALSFTLVLHELATNAVKYGALSAPEGRVEVEWRRLVANGNSTIRFSWIELNGPTVSLPSRKGFGTRLIDTMGRTFGGRSELRYDPSGVVWMVEAEAGRLKNA
ncbi:MAG: sensor histidine kinase [Caulobacteraceae bacterium]